MSKQNSAPRSEGVQQLRSKLFERRDFSIAQILPMLISYMDKELRYVYVNPAYEKWFNVKADDLIGMPVRDFVGDVVFERALPRFKRAFAGETVEFEQEAPYSTGTRNIHVYYTPDIDPDSGEVMGVIAVVNDVTARVKLEEMERKAAQAKSEELRRLTSLFEEAPIAMTLLEGKDHRFSFANRAYRNRFLHEEYLNLPIAEVLPATVEQGFVTLLDEVYATKAPFFGTETRFITTDKLGNKSESYFNFIFQPVVDQENNSTGILAIISDVSELVIATQQLILQREIREKFVSTLTHDLRTPLTAAKMSAQLIARKSKDQASVESLAGRVNSSLVRAETMVKDLLDANSINAGQGIPISRKPCELNEIVEETLLELLTVHGSRFNINKAQPELRGNWDPDALKRILENLLNNAVKYGDTQTMVTITTGMNAEKVFFSVHNKGPAISPKDQVFLFNSFNRAGSAIRSGKTGWGIGLSLVRALAEAHGGEVSVLSCEESGTTFTVTLP